MRSAWKAPHYNPKLCNLIEAKARLGRNRILRLSHRRVIIDSSMVACFFAVPNGMGRVRLGIHPDMVGHCIGEFIRTRRRTRHYRKKRQKNLEKRRKDDAKKEGAKERVVDTARISAMRQKRKSQK
jgi:ribosomal protein S19